jgi:hypothetical protein
MKKNIFYNTDNNFIYTTLGIGGFFTTFFFLTLSGNIAAAHDSIQYINEIDSKIWLFHPHHILYHPVSILWLDLLRLFRLQYDSAFLVASLNSIFSSATLVVIYIMLTRRLHSTKIGAFSTLSLLAFSFGYWYYSICVEIIAIPQFFLLLSLFFLMKTQLKNKDLILSGISQGIAILFFQIHILFTIAVWAKIYKSDNYDLPETKLKSFFYQLAPAAGISIVGYLVVLVFAIHATSFNEAFLWMTKYAHEMNYAWHIPNANSILKATIGFFHSIVGGHFILASQTTINQLQRLGNYELRDEMFLVRNLSSIGVEVLMVLTMFIGTILATVLIISLSLLKRTFNNLSSSTVTISIFLLSYCLFFFVWSPIDFQFWILQSLLCWLLLDRLLLNIAKKHRNMVTGIRLLLPALLLTVNLLGSILPLNARTNDYFYLLSKNLGNSVSSHDLIVSNQIWIEERYYLRYTNIPVFSIKELRENNSDSLLNRFTYETSLCLSQKGRLWLVSQQNESISKDTVLSNFQKLLSELKLLDNVQQSDTSVFGRRYFLFSKK